MGIRNGATELRPFDDQNLYEFRLFLKELGISHSPSADHLDGIVNPFERGEDVPFQLLHPPVSRGAKQLLLVPEIAIDGSFPHARLSGDDVNVRIAKTVLREHFNGGIQDGLLLVRIVASWAGGRGCHDSTPRRTDAPVRHILLDTASRGKSEDGWGPQPNPLRTDAELMPAVQADRNGNNLRCHC